MGYARVLWVYEDGVRAASESQERWDELRPAVGEAVLKVCTEMPIGDDQVSAPVLSHANCVNLCDVAHSTETKVYLWGENCLRPLRQLNDERFALVEQIVQEERKRREAER